MKSGQRVRPGRQAAVHIPRPGDLGDLSVLRDAGFLKSEASSVS